MCSISLAQTSISVENVTQLVLNALVPVIINAKPASLDTFCRVHLALILVAQGFIPISQVLLAILAILNVLHAQALTQITALHAPILHLFNRVELVRPIATMATTQT